MPRRKEIFNVILQETMKPKNAKWEIHIVQDVPIVERGESPFVVLKFIFLYNVKSSSKT